MLILVFARSAIISTKSFVYRQEAGLQIYVNKREFSVLPRNTKSAALHDAKSTILRISGKNANTSKWRPFRAERRGGSF